MCFEESPRQAYKAPRQPRTRKMSKSTVQRKLTAVKNAAARLTTAVSAAESALAQLGQ